MTTRISFLPHFVNLFSEVPLVACCLARDIKHGHKEIFRLKLISPTIRGFLLELEMGAMGENRDNSSIISITRPDVKFDYETLLQWFRADPTDKWVSNNAISLFAKFMPQNQLHALPLRNAELRGAILSGVNLSGADLTLAKLSEADLSEAVLNDAELRGADLRNAKLFGADLRNVKLFGADLRNADLRNANLRNADLRNANLEEVHGLEFTRSLEKTDMYSVKGLTKEQLKACQQRGATVARKRDLPD